MEPTTSLLDRPAAEAARLLALRLLDDAASARLRLSHPEDPEALHAFRVAIRRLRSSLRAWADVLQEGVSPKVLRPGTVWRSCAEMCSRQSERV